MAVTKKKVTGKATIDVELVVLRVGDSENGTEYALDTANKIIVEPQIETQDAIKLIKLGKLLAQKPKKDTITGHNITLTDNVFTPEIAKVLQGGKVQGTGVSLTYEPPARRKWEKRERFLNSEAYSAVYDTAGRIEMYEKITYPNCQGSPFGISSEDNVFRLPEYSISSAPSTGKPPYKISYVSELPVFSDAMALSMDMEEERETLLESKTTELARK